MYDKFKSITYEMLKGAVGEPPLSYRGVMAAGNIAVDVLKIHSLTRTYDTENSVAVTTHITVAVPTSALIYALSTSHGAIKFKLVTMSSGKPVETEMLFGVCQTQFDANVGGATINTGASDDISVSVVTLELYSEPIWINRIKQIGTTFHQENPLQAIKFILASLTNYHDATTSASSISYEEEEQKYYHSIQVPDSTPFLGVADYLQNHYGIYSKGLGICYHKKTWRIFMPYDERKFYSGGDRLCVYNLPEEQMVNLDRSFAINGKTLSIATSGPTQQADDRDINALNGGTGYRIGSVRSLDSGNLTLDPYNENETTPELFMSASNPNPHKTGLTNAGVVTGRYKDDDKSILSEFNRKRGQFIKVTWERSMYGVLHPGMAVKLMYPTQTGIVERYGTLVGEVYHTQLDGGSMASNRYVSNTELLLWVI